MGCNILKYIKVAQKAELWKASYRRIRILCKKGLQLIKSHSRITWKPSGHKDAILYVQKLVHDKVPFSEAIIKQIHTLALMDRREDRGIYRLIPVRIMGAYHTPPNPIRASELMEKLVREFEISKPHPIERAALFHLKFKGTHPFVDGNGRTERLILNLFLMQNGYPPINMKFAD